MFFFFFFYMCYFFIFFFFFFFFFSSRRRHTRCLSDWSSDVCSSDLVEPAGAVGQELLADRSARNGTAVRQLAQPRRVLLPRHVDEHRVGVEIGRASCRERV